MPADTEAQGSQGICPNCERSGPVGEVCPERGCERKGVHFIPQGNYQKLKAAHGHTIDAMIGIQVDDYLIVDLLGSGGFGSVYLCHQLPILLEGALKLMRTDESGIEIETLVEKFGLEARSLAQLHHPNIVRLLKYGSYGNVPYMVMEFVKNGHTLRDEVDDLAARGLGLGLELVDSIVTQMLHGLKAAHKLSIVHRDIKPENIMLQSVEGNAHFVRIVDFGLAKFLAEGSGTTKILGTPTYMAPEQFSGKSIGPWTDLYAAGVIAFELLTGRRPFSFRTVQELLAKKLSPDYNVLENARDLRLPAAVDRFLATALARDIPDRHKTVDDFLQAFQMATDALRQTEQAASLSGDYSQLVMGQTVDGRQPVEAGPPPQTEQMGKGIGKQVATVGAELVGQQVTPPEKGFGAKIVFIVAAAAVLVGILIGFALTRGPTTPTSSRAASAGAEEDVSGDTAPHTDTGRTSRAVADIGDTVTVARAKDVTSPGVVRREVEIRPYIKGSQEVLDGVQILVNGKRIGRSAGGRGVRTTFTAGSSYDVEASSPVIKSLPGKRFQLRDIRGAVLRIDVEFKL